MQSAMIVALPLTSAVWAIALSRRVPGRISILAATLMASRA